MEQCENPVGSLVWGKDQREDMCKNKTALISGKFDNVHPGHIVTVLRLGSRYSKVIVVVLDYPDQVFDINERVQVFKDVLRYAKGNYEVISNKEHFGFIKKEEVERLPDFDVYIAAQNYSVLEHMQKIGYTVENVPRYPGYTATDSRKYRQIMKFLQRIFDE